MSDHDGVIKQIAARGGAMKGDTIMKWFGDPWGAPVCSICPKAPVPVGQRCARCDKVLTDLDSGFLLPYYAEAGEPGFIPFHRQCFINSVLRMSLPGETEGVIDRPPQFSLDLDAGIVRYCAEECWRQGHREGMDLSTRTASMLRAWMYAMTAYMDLLEDPRPEPTIVSLDDIIALGKLVEPGENAKGLRKAVKMVRGRFATPQPGHIKTLLDDLLDKQRSFAPLAFYREFELIHPLAEGNGRVGKILLNWKNRTLDKPIFPPHDFWGRYLLNP